MAESMTFGYVRVSTKDQNEARQMKEMRELDIPERNIFMDKESGKDFDREQWRALVAMLRQGDLLYVHSLDRLGRNYEEIGNQWRHITKEIGADIVVMDMPILDTRTQKNLDGKFLSDLVLQILSYVAAKERENIRKRQREGIAIAKAEGKYRGRKPKEVDTAMFSLLQGEVERGERTNKYVMEKMGLKPANYWMLVKEYKTHTGRWAEKN